MIQCEGVPDSVLRLRASGRVVENGKDEAQGTSCYQDIDLKSRYCQESRPRCRCESRYTPNFSKSRSVTKSFTDEYSCKATKLLKTSFVNIVVVLVTLLSSVSTILYWLRLKLPGQRCCHCCLKEDSKHVTLSKELDILKHKDGNAGLYKAILSEKSDAFLCSEKSFKHSFNYDNIKDSKNTYYDFTPKHFRSSLDYIFAHFRPALTSCTVYPVCHQNPNQGQNSHGRKDAEEESPNPPSRDQQWPPETVYGMPWATFRRELHRLGTFMDMPPNSPVFALRLAQKGFLRLPEGFIICYFCGLRRDAWNAGELPAEVHRQLRPDCPMSTGADCDNEPVGIVGAEQVEELMHIWSLSGPPLLLGRDPVPQRGEAAAANTETLPPQVTPSASSGEACGGGPQTVTNQPSAVSGSGAQGSRSADIQATVTAPSGQNVSAGNNRANSLQQPRLGLMGGAAASANPEMGNPPRAPIFDGTAQPQVPADTSDARSTFASEPRPGQQVVTYQQLGIVTEEPKRPDMAMIHARVGTFRNWPSTSSHTPLELSEAGFYYAGYADCGRCFFCGGGLKNWEPTDNPWVEHARWFAKCSYVRQCQGQDFIDIIQELNDANGRQISLNQVREEIRRRRADGERIQEPVTDPAITSALEVGYTLEAVDAAVQRVQTEGHQLTAARLVDSLQADSSVAAGGGDAIADVSDSELGQIEALASRNNDMRQQRMCKICLDKEVCIVFLPCGHLVCCSECSPALRHCPMCRQRVKGRVRAFPA